MAPNNWEEQIKQQLQGREIQPSAQAWDRLDAMLTVAEEKKTKRPFGVYFRYMAIAASVLVFLSLGFYFTSDLPEPDANTPTGVAQEQESDVPGKSAGSINNESAIESPLQQETVAEQPTAIQNKGSLNKATSSQPNKRNLNQQLQSTTESYAATAVPKSQSVQETLPAQPQTSTGANPTADIALAQPQLAKTNIKINAASLLDQVDGELNQSFRERMFDRLNRNYQSAKSAIATRNQE